MNIVCVASEGVPFAKTGGLADVASALPRALEKLGHQVCLFLPCHRSAWSAGSAILPGRARVQVPIRSKSVMAPVHESRLPGSNVPVYLIDQPAYFDRDEIYQVGGKDYEDNCERFVFFDRAVLEAIPLLGKRVDVIHCNDWQTGLIPVYLKTLYRRVPALAGVGTLMTVHNLAYLGLFWHWDMPLTGLDWNLFNYHALEFHGRISFMKAGLVFADLLNTVSPTYSREIQTPTLGCGLDGLLRERQADLRGIVNGIDIHCWSPAHEPMLPARYDAATFREGKSRCKAWLQTKAGLPTRPEVPLLAQIGRLDAQKGWDLLAEAAPGLLERDLQLIVLGTGHLRYARLLRELARAYPARVSFHPGFCEDLAHQIEAGADIFLMPSLFEPCGLNQLYSLAHGTVPVVRATGGLADTVVNFDDESLASGSANGFSFTDATSDALAEAIGRALATWPNREVWDQLICNGMRADWSWSHSAREYAGLYSEIVRRVQPSPLQSVAGDPAA
jgi:starch synthase